jgi:hypothetical protein
VRRLIDPLAGTPEVDFLPYRDPENADIGHIGIERPAPLSPLP